MCATRASDHGTADEHAAVIMIAIRHFFTVAASALVLASCASAQREDDGDRQVDELGSIEQLPHSAVCSGGTFRCKARVRTDAQNRITPFAAPKGLGPADLASAYKLDSLPILPLKPYIALRITEIR